jgi:hypothetical protein
MEHLNSGTQHYGIVISPKYLEEKRDSVNWKHEQHLFIEVNGTWYMRICWSQGSNNISLPAGIVRIPEKTAQIIAMKPPKKAA